MSKDSAMEGSRRAGGYDSFGLNTGPQQRWKRLKTSRRAGYNEREYAKVIHWHCRVAPSRERMEDK